MAPKKLKPITREALRAFYAQFPLTPVPEAEANFHISEIEKLTSELGLPGSKVTETLGIAVPTRIDDIFWRNRCFMEEISHNLAAVTKQAAVDSSDLQSVLTGGERRIFKVQENNTEAAAAQIRQFLPKDIRGTLLQMKQASDENKNQKAIEDLIKSGGTIRQKYDLYLKQQWARRESLAQMGQLSGVYKSMVKFIGGIPQVLLDFAKEINAKLGPMEEQRIKYGPDLYLATGLGIKIDIFTFLWVERLAEEKKSAKGGRKESEKLPNRRSDEEVMSVLRPAIEFYAYHLLRCLEFLGSIFIKSPFFLDADAEVVSSPVGGSPNSSIILDVAPHLDAVPEDESVTREHIDRPSGRKHRSSASASILSPGHSHDSNIAVPVRRPSGSGSALIAAAASSPSTDGSQVWNLGTVLGRISRPRGSERAQSIVSEGWMSADDNASWVEPAGNSYQGDHTSCLNEGGRLSHTGAQDLHASRKLADVRDVVIITTSQQHPARETHSITVDARSVKGGRLKKQHEGRSGCLCFGGSRKALGAMS
ncbi:hypothetical protein CEUSTIGMA_g7998.t1 [Chlamydomonas eustigma]|uniref:Uncharacterized protein n=1 Tax=Chlamydomonas eustigma TaxID=1157962 RepID=A0A250XBV4_9CHLO|nr:hypothetical protein CEUSTIGMA_g7998.t1 [Chlamydomonas eustigma]|eukprot:GAX80561.1 hypothetical protein CEUSTIGMA_g7998.t1 [Chlamydomonas eustigma]